MEQKIDTIEILQKIREFILDTFPVAKQQNISDEDLLLGTNIMDSIGILQIITFLEEEFGVAFEDDEFIPENFQSIAHITSFIQQKID